MHLQYLDLAKNNLSNELLKGQHQDCVVSKQEIKMEREKIDWSQA